MKDIKLTRSDRQVDENQFKIYYFSFMNLLRTFKYCTRHVEDFWSLVVTSHLRDLTSYNIQSLPSIRYFWVCLSHNHQTPNAKFEKKYWERKGYRHVTTGNHGSNIIAWGFEKTSLTNVKLWSFQTGHISQTVTWWLGNMCLTRANLHISGWLAWQWLSNVPNIIGDPLY